MLKGVMTSLALLVLLTGCRVVWSDESLAEETSHETTGSEVVKLDANVNFSQAKLIIRGQTNLPEGAVIHADIKAYPEYKDGSQDSEPVTVEEILNAAIEPSDEVTLKATGQISEDGTFLIVMKRKDKYKRYQLRVKFLPDLQPSGIQEKYGPEGSNIGESDGLYQYEAEGKSYNGIAKYAPLPKVTDSGFYSGKFKLHGDPAKAKPYW